MDELPFSLHNALMSHYYRNGSMYPKNGTIDIIESLVSSIIQNRGTLLTKAYVEKIIVEGKKAVGVELKGGVIIKCKNIISTMGIPNTIKALPE